MSFFGVDKRCDNELVIQSNETSVAVSRKDSNAVLSNSHGSNTNTVVRKGSVLRLVGASEDADATMIQSLPSSPEDGIVSSLSGTSHDFVRRKLSAPTLQTKIQHRLQQTFGGQPTVVVRSDLKSRPSVQTLQNESPDLVTSQVSSSPSTYNSGSGSSPKGAHKSTPATSEGGPPTPTSVRRYEGITLVDNDQSLLFDQDAVRVSNLSTIPESTTGTALSIKTVEATASAKVFFETHFNIMMNVTSPRSVRVKALQTRMRDLCVPTSLQEEAYKALQQQENVNLRWSRVLQNPRASKSGSVVVGGFEVVKLLGKGSFGVVRLVKEKPSVGLIDLSSKLLAAYTSRRQTSPVKKQVCAMKVIRKSDMLRNGQEGHLRAERDFLVAAEGSQWIVPLLAAFQDSRFLYLVMDFCIGGDFLGLLIRKNILNEDVTRWYVAEMIMCVEEAHRMKWIHRDVKPDNFLIGADGHLKISDFGLAFDGEWEHDQQYFHKLRCDVLDKLDVEVTRDEQDIADEAKVDNAKRVAEIFPPPGCPPPKKYAAADDVPTNEHILDWRNRAQRRRLARSVVGTSQYMAPEVIRGDLYDGRCD